MVLGRLHVLTFVLGYRTNFVHLGFVTPMGLPNIVYLEIFDSI